MATQKYTRQEVEAILTRAIEGEGKRGDLSHEDLIAAANEVGLSTEAIEAAASEVLAERVRSQELATVRREQWQGFVGHLIPYTLVNGMFVTLNVWTTHFPWAAFPALGWGIGLISHLFAVIRPDPMKIERRMQRLRERQRRQELKHKIRNEARRIEADVGDGINAVLHAVAQRMAVSAQGEPKPSARVRAPDQRGDEMGEVFQSAPSRNRTDRIR